MTPLQTILQTLCRLPGVNPWDKVAMMQVATDVTQAMFELSTELENTGVFAVLPCGGCMRIRRLWVN